MKALALHHIADGDYAATDANEINWGYMEISGDSYVHRARNTIADRFLADPDATDLFYIDSDMSWNPEALVQMVLLPDPVIEGSSAIKNLWHAWSQPCACSLPWRRAAWLLPHRSELSPPQGRGRGLAAAHHGVNTHPSLSPRAPHGTRTQSWGLPSGNT